MKQESLSIYKRDTVEGISLSLICDKRRSVQNEDKDNDYYPIKIRVHYNTEDATSREKKWINSYIGIGKKITLNDWEDTCNENCRKSRIKDIKDELDPFFDRAVSIVKDLCTEKCFSFEKLKEKFFAVSAKADDKNDVICLIQRKIEKLRSENKYNTLLTYKNTMNSIIKFKEFCDKDSDRKSNKITVTGIDVKWLKNFEKYLSDDGKSVSTIGIYMRNLRCIVKSCVPDIINEKLYPFGEKKYEIPSGGGRDIALNKEQISMIKSYDDGLESTRKYRDLWIFSFLCNGINMGDMFRLRYNDIVNNEISFYRHKTIDRVKDKNKARIYAPIDDDMWNIIYRWGNKQSENGLIFPFLNGITNETEMVKRIGNVTRQINKCICKIGKDLNLGNLSTYSARHSFASVMLWEGASVGFISQSLGHTNILTTTSYLSKFNVDKRKEEHDKLKL